MKYYKITNSACYQSDTGKSEYFTLAAILGVITGIKLGPFEDIHTLMEFLLDQPLFTHWLPRIQPICRDELLRQFPQLAKIKYAKNNNWRQFLNRKEKQFGKMLLVHGGARR